jgi:hypothetical protein
MGEQCFRGCDHADTRTCVALIAENVPPGNHAALYRRVAELSGSPPAHTTVYHGMHGWARDDDGDGRREAHCNACEGAEAALRTYLLVFRGVRQQYLHLYVATYEAMASAKRVTPDLIRRMCVGNLSAYTGYT